MIAAEIQTRCLECGDEHPMLMSLNAEDEEPFEGQCPECDEYMTKHEIVDE